MAAAAARIHLGSPVGAGREAALCQLGFRRPPGLFHVLYFGGGWVGLTVWLLIIAAFVIASVISKRRNRNGKS